MPSQENGDSNNVTFPSPVNIQSSTNTNPIVIQTSSAHGLTTGDEVDVADHVTNTTANGVWRATVVDSTHFSVPVAGIATGGATGTVQSLALGSTFQIPSDGDDDKAASFNVAYEALADRTAKLAVMTGGYKTVGIKRSVVTVTDPGTPNGLVINAATGAFGTAVQIGNYVPTGVAIIPGDLFEVEFRSTAVASGGAPATFALGLFYDFGAGTGANDAQSLRDVIGNASCDIGLYGMLPTNAITSPQNGVYFYVRAWASTGTPTITGYGTYQVVIRHLRATGMPQ